MLRQILLIILFSGTLSLQTSASSEIYERLKDDPNFSHYVSWLPAHIKEDQDLTAQCVLLQADKRELATGFSNELTVLVDSDKNFYGTNSPNIDKLREKLLIEIRGEFEQTGVPPHVGEFGPGHGLLSQNIVIARGDVTAIELQKNALGKWASNMEAIKPFLLPDEEFSNVARGIQGDITDPKTFEGLDKFKFIVSTDVIQFLTPAQMDNCIDNIWNSLQDGGRVFLSSPTPSTIPQWLFYKQSLQQGNKYPGYMLYNDFPYAPTCYSPGDKVPGKVYPGYYDGEKTHAYFLHENRRIMIDHKVRNFFTPETLETLLKDRGFKVEEAYYRDVDNQKILPEAFNRKPDYKTLYTTCIVAEKPKNRSDEK